MGKQIEINPHAIEDSRLPSRFTYHTNEFTGTSLAFIKGPNMETE